MREPTFEDVVGAAPVVHRYLLPTSLYEWPVLSDLLGFRYLLKHENQTPTGAFKVRGGIYLVSQLSEEQRARGIAACTTGNHGQSLAYACRLFGARCVLVVPEGNNPDKNASMRALGAELIEHGRDYDDARLWCETMARDRGLRYVHSADEPDLIAGVGSYALEIFNQLPSPDVILVPVGLGTGACATALVAAARSPQTAVIGVQAELAPAVALSWGSDRPVETAPPRTFAEGMATRMPAGLTLQLMRRMIREFVLVSESELRQAVRTLLQATHNLAEGAGAAATAAAFRLRRELAGKTVVGVLSGGNLDLKRLPAILNEIDRPVPVSSLPHRVGAFLFDLDGTLVDSYAAITASVNHVRSAHGLPPLSQTEVRQHVGRGSHHLLERTVPGGDPEESQRRFHRHHPSVLHAGTRLLPGAEEALRAVQGAGMRIGICTNKPLAFTRGILEHFGLARLIDAVVGPEDVERLKPAPDMLQVCLNRLNVDPTQAVYVGDMSVDVESARAAGITVWTISTGSEEAGRLAAAYPDRLLNDLGDLPTLLQILGAGPRAPLARP